MVEKIFLVLLVILAIVCINTEKLRKAVIFLGIFSLVGSFTYLLYGAPDVAIAEAIIGSGIATVLYLVAIKRYRIFTIYHICHEAYESHPASPPVPVREQTKLIKEIEKLFADKDLEPHIITTLEDSQFIRENKAYDLIIETRRDEMILFGFSADYHLDDIEKLTKKKKYTPLNISIIRYDEGVIPNAQVD